MRHCGRSAPFSSSAWAFPDHHPFRVEELEGLRRDARRSGARLITTTKDFVRMPSGQRAGIEVLEVEIRWPEPAALARLLSPIVAICPWRWTRVGRALRLRRSGQSITWRPGQRRCGSAPSQCCRSIASSTLGGAMGRLIGPLLGISNRARHNIKRALPGLSESEIADSHRRHVGQSWPRSSRIFPPRKIRVFEPGGRFETRGFEHLDRAVAVGRRMIIFSGHIANWEIGMLAAVQYGISVAQIYRAAEQSPGRLHDHPVPWPWR